MRNLRLVLGTYLESREKIFSVLNLFKAEDGDPIVIPPISCVIIETCPDDVPWRSFYDYRCGGRLEKEDASPDGRDEHRVSLGGVRVVGILDCEVLKNKFKEVWLVWWNVLKNDLLHL